MSKTKTGHSVRHGFSMTLDQRMDRLRKRGYTTEKTPNGILVHPPAKGKDCEDAD